MINFKNAWFEKEKRRCYIVSSFGLTAATTIVVVTLAISTDIWQHDHLKSNPVLYGVDAGAKPAAAGYYEFTAGTTFGHCGQLKKKQLFKL